MDKEPLPVNQQVTKVNPVFTPGLTHEINHIVNYCSNSTLLHNYKYSCLAYRVHDQSPKGDEFKDPLKAHLYSIYTKG